VRPYCRRSGAHVGLENLTRGARVVAFWRRTVAPETESPDGFCYQAGKGKQSRLFQGHRGLLRKQMEEIQVQKRIFRAMALYPIDKV
jgi:hypothetical protein